MPTRLCLGCGRFTSGGSYCPACLKTREAAKLRRAPWLAIYKQPDWQVVKWAIHKRDGFRCTFADKRGRCTQTSQTTRLEAHHVRKVRDLWLDADRDWDTFLSLALDKSNLVSLCYKHHLKADKQKPGRRKLAAFSARPLP